MRIAMFFSGRISCCLQNNWAPEFIKNNNVDTFVSLNSKEPPPKVFLNLYNVKKYHYAPFLLKESDYNLFNRVVIPKNSPINNICSMFWNHQKCMSLIQEYQEENNIKYDLIIYSRTDTIVRSSCKFPIVEPKDNIIYIPNCNNWNGVNDQMAYGNFETMKKYVSIYGLLKSYIGKCKFNPELLMNHHLRAVGLTIKRFEFPYKLNPKRFGNSPKDGNMTPKEIKTKMEIKEVVEQEVPISIPEVKIKNFIEKSLRRKMLEKKFELNEPKKPEPKKPEPKKPEPKKSEPKKSEPKKPEPKKSEPNKPDKLKLFIEQSTRKHARKI